MICAPTTNDFPSSHGQQVPDPDQQLFLERFEVFMDKSMNEIQAFSDREGRAFEQVLYFHFLRDFGSYELTLYCYCRQYKMLLDGTSTVSFNVNTRLHRLTFSLS
jgi:hypothetical protein